MTLTGPSRMLPMEATGTQHLVDRAYRETGTFQWVRETYTNAREAGATRVEFGIEWQAVDSLGVYRRLIADNGSGMTPEQLVEFFNTFGGGGKRIGGLHENFGIGAKTSLFPWNRHGVVVVSWVDGEPAMIWVTCDDETGEYGLRLIETADPESGELVLDEVYEPYYDPDQGCDWKLIRPPWLHDHGTVIVLLGNEPTDDTVLGDPNRNESDIKGISTYLNRRLWEIPESVTVRVDELRAKDRATWPRNQAESGGAAPKQGTDRRTNTRTINGARHFIEYPDFTPGRIAASNTVSLRDGTEIDWYLWEGDRPAVQSYAAVGGFIGALYMDELYDVSAHPSTFRSFGISEASVRSRVWLVLRPVRAEDDRHGVYPRGDRNSLLLKGGPQAGTPLPIADWAGEFADNMPEPLREAIRAARGGGSGAPDDSWLQRLADRFGLRWRISKLRSSKVGTERLDPSQEGTRPRRVKSRKPRNGGSSGGAGGRTGSTNIGNLPGDTTARRVKVAGGIPRYRIVRGSDVEDGMLAAWQPNDPEFPEGAVLINADHPVMQEEITYWQGQYGDHHAEAVANDVLATYGEIAVAKVAHSEFLKGILPARTVDRELRSEAALTMALLGLMGEEAVIAPRLGGKYGKQKIA